MTLPAPEYGDIVKFPNERSYSVRMSSDSKPYVIRSHYEFRLDYDTSWSYDTDAMLSAAKEHDEKAARLRKKLELICEVAPETISVDGVVDDRGIKYIGLATKQPDGKWRCLAIVDDALCLVEATITIAERT